MLQTTEWLYSLVPSPFFSQKTFVWKLMQKLFPMGMINATPGYRYYTFALFNERLHTIDSKKTWDAEIK